MGDIHDLTRLFDAGGPVLWAILLVAIALWTLILERYWYQLAVFPVDLDKVRARRARIMSAECRIARMVLRKDVSELALNLNRYLTAIRTLVAACPLLGLLGTVVGMIHVFDVIGFSGTGNPRAMATGVSMATIPTMAGLVVALSGVVFSFRLQRGSRERLQRAEGLLMQDVFGRERPGRLSTQSCPAKLEPLKG
jgi:biopolymer transport protein ExbB